MQCPHCSGRIARTDRICPACRCRVDTGEKMDLTPPRVRKRARREHVAGAAKMRAAAAGPVVGSVRGLVRGVGWFLGYALPGAADLGRRRYGHGLAWFAVVALSVWVAYVAYPAFFLPGLVFALTAWASWTLEARNGTGCWSPIVGFLITGGLLLAVAASVAGRFREDVADQVLLAVTGVAHVLTLVAVVFPKRPRDPGTRLLRIVVVLAPLLCLVYFPVWRSYFFTDKPRPSDMQEAQLFAGILVDPIFGIAFGLAFAGVAAMAVTMFDRTIEIFGRFFAARRGTV